MAITAISNIENSVRWTVTTTDSNLLSTDRFKSLFSNSITSGSDAGSINTTFFTFNVLPSGQIIRYDMFNLTGSGVVGSVDFSGGYVKLIHIKNTTINSGDDYNINLYGTGLSGVIGPFSSGYLKTIIYPNSYNIFYHPYSGHLISTGERYFYIEAIKASGGIPYDLSIFGKV